MPGPTLSRSFLALEKRDPLQLKHLHLPHTFSFPFVLRTFHVYHVRTLISHHTQQLTVCGVERRTIYSEPHLTSSPCVLRLNESGFTWKLNLLISQFYSKISSPCCLHRRTVVALGCGFHDFRETWCLRSKRLRLPKFKGLWLLRHNARTP